MSIDMIVFAEDWGRHPSSTQHLIRQLLPEQQILWVNSLGLRRPRLCQRDIKRAWSKLQAMTKQPAPEVTLENTNALAPQLINPCSIPLPGSRFARWLNQQLLRNRLLPLLDHKQDQRPLLWTSLPSAVDVVGKLGERAAIYYCGDDFSALDGVDHEPIQQMEQELAEKCQLIITSSDQLAKKFPAEKTFLLPHGVDCELFGSAKPRAEDLPSNGPVAGFYGAIAGWFDQALFIELAKRLPHWSFVLIGPAHTDISKLLAQPNIQWLGAKPHDQLATYSQHWDVGLLPFVNNAQIRACNPLKLREYLAAGSLVVSTDFPALNGYRDLIKVASDAYGFAVALEDYYQSKSDQAVMRNLRQQRVANESWARRAVELKTRLATL